MTGAVVEGARKPDRERRGGGGQLNTVVSPEGKPEAKKRGRSRRVKREEEEREKEKIKNPPTVRDTRAVGEMVGVQLCGERAEIWQGQVRRHRKGYWSLRRSASAAPALTAQ
jgi:hypothetical protein